MLARRLPTHRSRLCPVWSLAAYKGTGLGLELPILDIVANRDFDTPAAKDGGVAPSRGYAHDWLGGLDGKLIDETVDEDSHNLHLLVGNLCPTCGRVIESGQPARRMMSGKYKHDSC